MRFEIYEDAKGLWRWRLAAPNGRIIAESGEGYARRRDVRRAIDGAMRGALVGYERLVMGADAA